MSLDSIMTGFGNLLTLVSAALGGSAMHRQVILSCNAEKLILPVTPASYDMQTSQNNRTVDIIEFGEAQLFGNPALKRLKFSSFFPSLMHEYPFIVGDSKTPAECIELLTKWKEAKAPIRVIITDTNINLMMGLKQFDYSERDGSRDVYYTLSFIEYKELNTPMANNDKQTSDETGLKERASDVESPDTVTLVDKANDVLDASKKVYGDYTHYRNIIQSNNLKDLAINNIGKLKLGERLKVPK